MQQIKLISKLGLAVIAITALSAAVAVQAFYHYSYFTQSPDAQAQELPVPPPNVPLNSVATQHIIDGQVMTQDLANENVTTAKIKDGEVKSADIGNREVKHEDIAQGTITLFPRLEFGPPLGGVVIPVGGDGVATVFCRGDSVVTGGGYEVLSGTLEVREDRPLFTLQEGEGWRVTAHNGGGTEGQLRVWAVCLYAFP